MAYNNSSLVRRAAEKVSSYPLVLTVVVRRLDGVLAIHIPPPPSDTIWYANNVYVRGGGGGGGGGDGWKYGMQYKAGIYRATSDTIWYAVYVRGGGGWKYGMQCKAGIYRATSGNLLYSTQLKEMRDFSFSLQLFDQIHLSCEVALCALA